MSCNWQLTCFPYTRHVNNNKGRRKTKDRKNMKTAGYAFKIWTREFNKKEAVDDNALIFRE